jgi:hypothetical protein
VSHLNAVERTGYARSKPRKFKRIVGHQQFLDKKKPSVLRRGLEVDRSNFLLTNAVDVDQKWRAVSSSVIQKVNCIASDSRQLSKKVVEPFFGRIATKAAN